MLENEEECYHFFQGLHDLELRSMGSALRWRAAPTTG